jgi:hypothetical protein
MNRIRFGITTIGVVMLLLIFALIGAGCNRSSDSEPTEIPTPVSVSPTVDSDFIKSTAGVTSTPTPTRIPPTATALVQATAELSDSEQLVVLEKLAVDQAVSRRCELSSGTSGFGGTAPGPTPTPVPDSGGAVGLHELNVNAALGIADHISVSSIAFEELWPLAVEQDEQAALLMELNGRLSFLCDSTRYLGGANRLDLQIASVLSEAVRTRHVWTVLAIGELTCCDNAKATSLAIGRQLTHENLIRVVDDIRGQLSESVVDKNIFNFERLELQLETPADWILAGAESRPILIAPTSEFLLGFSGLGPNDWGTGVSMRIRRFRVNSEISLSEATESFKNLALNFGSVSQKSESEFLGSPATKWVVASSDTEWNTEIYLTVLNGYAYVLDLGCPAANPESCTLLRNLGSEVELAE